VKAPTRISKVRGVVPEKGRWFEFENIRVPNTNNDNITLNNWEKAYAQWQRQMNQPTPPNKWGKAPKKSKKNYIKNKFKK
jgi:hypothetical protein